MQKKFINRWFFIGGLALAAFSCDDDKEPVKVHGANFETSIEEPGEGKRIKFTNTSANAGEAIWLFGDGETSDEFSPIHQYASPGTYQVELISIGIPGSDPTTSRVVKPLIVTLPPILLCEVKTDAANYITGGDMESASAWTVQGINDLVNANIAFGSTTNAPCASTGGAFRLNNLTPYSNNGNVMWQSLGNLPVGRYRFSGDVNIQTGEDPDATSTNINRARWFFLELIVSKKTPPVGDGFNEPVISGFNAWHADNATVNNAIPAGKGSFPVIAFPFEASSGLIGNERGEFQITEAGVYNFVIKFGTYANGGVDGSYGKDGITMDNLAIVKLED